MINTWKDERLHEFLELLARRSLTWRLNNNWDGDECAIGITSDTHPDRLAYISCWDQPEGHFFLELEISSPVPEQYQVAERVESCPVDAVLVKIVAHLGSDDSVVERPNDEAMNE